MNCLILAAGHGSRLREVSESKPLTPLAGRPLIAHVIEAAMAAGATAFTVVTGHQAERVEAFLTELAERLGVEHRLRAARRLGQAQRPFGARRLGADRRRLSAADVAIICSIPRSRAGRSRPAGRAARR